MKTVSGRNYGVDLLRIVCMLMILILHILGRGGILDAEEPFSAGYELAWFLETAAYCAVNCYALISGYVYYGAKYKYANIIQLYLQVAFYTVLVSILFAVFKPGTIGIKSIIKRACFSYVYGPWYFAAYFCMFFFIPFLNLVLDKFEKQNMQKLLITVILICSVLPTLFRTDMAKLFSGYSPLWLALLYLLGGYIKKYGLWDKMKNWKNLRGYLFCVLISWLAKLIIELLTSRFLQDTKGGDFLINYTSPTIILCAVFLVIYFSKLNVSQGMCKVINFFAPASFGVYLFHVEPLIQETFITGKFVDCAQMPAGLMILTVLGMAALIWLIGSLIDRMRIALFDLLQIKKLCIQFEKNARILFAKVCPKLTDSGKFNDF